MRPPSPPCGLSAANADPRWVEAPSAEAVVGELQLGENVVLRDVLYGAHERSVGGQVHHAQVAGGEHGCHLLGAREALIQLHMSNVFVPGGPGGLLVYWRRGNGLDVAGEGHLPCLEDPLNGGLARGGGNLAGRHVLCVEVARVQDRHGVGGRLSRGRYLRHFVGEA